MTTQPPRQNWDESIRIGEDAVDAVIDFLKFDTARKHWHYVKLIEPVEKNRHYQGQDIDLLLIVKTADDLQRLTIEVKGDRNDKSGNFFIETVSDTERNSLGAFFASQAEWYFYYFLNSKTLYCIPLPAAREWFIKHSIRFQERTSHSQRRNATWNTKGALVPIRVLGDEVLGVGRFWRDEGGWKSGKPDS